MRLLQKSLCAVAAILLVAAPLSAQEDEYKHHKAALKAGDMAPMFVLPNGQDQEIALEYALEKGPALVFFYRGNWCPFCVKYMKDLAEAMPEIQKMGVSVFAISPQLPKYSAESAEKMDGAYHVLSDPDMTAAKAFGLDFALDAETQELYKGYGVDLAAVNGEAGWQLPVPGYFIIDRDGTIVWAYANEDYKVRPEAEVILTELKKLQK
jgi:peroxiredoxin